MCSTKKFNPRPFDPKTFLSRDGDYVMVSSSSPKEGLAIIQCARTVRFDQTTQNKLDPSFNFITTISLIFWPPMCKLNWTKLHSRN